MMVIVAVRPAGNQQHECQKPDPMRTGSGFFGEKGDDYQVTLRLERAATRHGGGRVDMSCALMGSPGRPQCSG
jgi:hypothetical protein